MILSPIFYSPIWYKDNILDKSHLENLIRFTLEYESNIEGRIISNQGGYQSKDISLEIRKTYFYDVEKIFLTCIKDCLDSIKSNKILKISNLWFNINRNNNYNLLHNHPGSYLSGVYYLYSNDLNSKLRFFRNNSDSYLYSLFVNDNYLNYDIQTFEPIQNRLIIFPSWYNHDVSPGNENSLRISISFNTNIDNDKI